MKEKELKQLTSDYVTEQTEIAKKRKRGGFKSKDEDINRQKQSWENFLLKKFGIVGDNKLEVFNYFKERALSQGVRWREKYHNNGKKLTEKNYANGQFQILENFEDKLIHLKIVKQHTDEKWRKKLLANNRRQERYIEKKYGSVFGIALPFLCVLQIKDANIYFNEIKKQNDL